MTGCGCTTCLRYSAAYLRHLFVAEELLGYRLLTIHNLWWAARLAEGADLPPAEPALAGAVVEVDPAMLRLVAGLGRPSVACQPSGPANSGYVELRTMVQMAFCRTIIAAGNVGPAANRAWASESVRARANDGRAADESWRAEYDGADRTTEDEPELWPAVGRSSGDRPRRGAADSARC